jgi:hypothetical protein
MAAAGALTIGGDRVGSLYALVVFDTQIAGSGARGYEGRLVVLCASPESAIGNSSSTGVHLEGHQSSARSGATMVRCV